jgi:hypothetical protein
MRELTQRLSRRLCASMLAQQLGWLLPPIQALLLQSHRRASLPLSLR